MVHRTKSPLLASLGPPLPHREMQSAWPLHCLEAGPQRARGVPGDRFLYPVPFGCWVGTLCPAVGRLPGPANLKLLKTGLSLRLQVRPCLFQWWLPLLEPGCPWGAPTSGESGTDEVPSDHTQGCDCPPRLCSFLLSDHNCHQPQTLTGHLCWLHCNVRTHKRTSTVYGAGTLEFRSVWSWASSLALCATVSLLVNLE